MAIASVADAATSQTLLASANRNGCSVFNDSTEILYLAIGVQTVTTALYSVKLGPGDYWEAPDRLAAVAGLSGIWANNASGAALVTEW